MRLLRWLFLLVLASSAIAVHADRDIVYAARYYTPPGSHRASHFHLYRINPDGTGRTQLTYGAHDDTAPKWSPDGREISFVRDGNILCVLKLGGEVKHLMADREGTTAPHSISDDITDAEWLPDSRSLVVISDDGGDAQGEVIDANTGETISYIPYALDYAISPSGKYAYLQTDKVPCSLEQIIGHSRRTLKILKSPLLGAAWLNDRTLVGLTDTAQPASYALASCPGGVLQSIQRDLFASIGSDDSPYLEGPTFLQTLPGDSRHVLFASDQSSSTVQPKYDFSEMTVSNCSLHWFLRSRQFVSFSSDGRHYCTAPSCDLSPYIRRQYPLNDPSEPVVTQYRMVWTAPLQTGLVARRNLRTITPGLVWVIGADWRKGQP